MAAYISDYKKWILETLLGKYEKSTAYKTGVSTRRILLTVPKERRLSELLEQVDEKRLFLDTLKSLKDQGLIDYSWVKYEAGNLVDKIWLIPEAAPACYLALGRVSPLEMLDDFISMASDYAGQLSPGSEFAAYLDGVLACAGRDKKIRAPFTDNMDLNRNLLACLLHLEEAPNQMERVFSTRLYGDSKYFERVLKTKVISILKEIQRTSLGSGEDTAQDYLSGDDLLAARGLYRWPELYEFCGPVSFTLDDGSHFDASAQKYGACINSDTVRHLLAADGSRVRRVIFIENKANYVDFQLNRKSPDDLIVFHGGFYSPMKGLFFAKLFEGCPQAAFYHWSDIDLGGFRLFHRLKKNLIPPLLPLSMDVSTLRSNAASCMEIKTESYLAQLSSLLTSEDYSIFFDVIRYMIQNRVRLEQEALLH